MACGQEPAPTSAMRSEGEAALSELREQLKQREAEDLACPEVRCLRGHVVDFWMILADFWLVFVDF